MGHDVQHPWDVSDDGARGVVIEDEHDPVVDRLDRIEAKLDAVLEVFGQLAVLLDQLKGKSLLDVLRGK